MSVLEREARERELTRAAIDTWPGDLASATGWLERPHPSFGGESPLAMARTRRGTARVLGTLAAIRHGLPS